MNYLSIVWELLIHLFEVIIFYLYISTILTPKEHKNWDFTLCGLLALRFTAIIIGNAFAFTSACILILAFAFNFLIAKILFKETSFLCVFWVGIHSVLGIIGKLISIFLLTTFSPIQPNEIFLDDSYRILYTTIYIICLAVLSFWVATTGSLILLHIYELARIRQENKELQERAKLLELETQQYHNLLDTTESLRAIKHDVHHHLATIQGLIQMNDQARLIQYLNEYEEHFNLDYSISATGNIVVDSILSAKTFLAKQQATKLEFSVMLPDSIPFSDVALSALLGNLFDNALEACKRLSPEEERFITFQMKAQENMLVIHIENSYDGIVKKDKHDTYLSRKKEPSHGIGLKRVHTLVEEVNGFTEIRHSDTIFTVHIMVPLENTNEF